MCLQSPRRRLASPMAFPPAGTPRLDVTTPAPAPGIDWLHLRRSKLFMRLKDGLVELHYPGASKLEEFMIPSFVANSCVASTLSLSQRASNIKPRFLLSLDCEDLS